MASSVDNKRERQENKAFYQGVVGVKLVTVEHQTIQ